MMIHLRGPYKKRPIRFLEIATYHGWRIKVYGIRFHEESVDDRPDPQIIEMARRALLPNLPLPAVTGSRYGVGFLIIHQGASRNWLLLDWWYDQEILKQQLFSSPLEAPDQIEPAESDLLACTWELAVHTFERQAWIDHVLNNRSGPDIDAYLGDGLNQDI